MRYYLLYCFLTLPTFQNSLMNIFPDKKNLNIIFHTNKIEILPFLIIVFSERLIL